MILDLPDVKSEDCENNQDSNSEVKDWNDMKKFVVHMGKYGGFRRYKCSLCGKLSGGKKAGAGPSDLLYHIKACTLGMCSHTLATYVMRLLKPSLF